MSNWFLTPGVRCVPHTRYWWRVEVWLNNKKVVSEPMWFETGKFSATDWEASWITDGYDKDYEPSPMFRKVFDVSKEVVSARCYISGLGYYRLSFNGKAVNDHALDPGFTDYSKRVLYLTYDISGLLRHGKNCIGFSWAMAGSMSKLLPCGTFMRHPGESARK